MSDGIREPELVRTLMLWSPPRNSADGVGKESAAPATCLLWMAAKMLANTANDTARLPPLHLFSHPPILLSLGSHSSLFSCSRIRSSFFEQPFVFIFLIFSAQMPLAPSTQPPPPLPPPAFHSYLSESLRRIEQPLGKATK
ncbi:unnamed protein product [Taenia asiatica]|uniref:Uncharacterized protein n=1 Tax=Taenia asiatica TaxID=60517 RepID=A0A0R3WGW2_TAEAS|nr:unnamed protein product [Taenia asiatica]